MLGRHSVATPAGSTHCRNISQSTKGWPLVGSTVGAALRGHPSLPSNQRRGGHGVATPTSSIHCRNMSQSTKGWPRSATPTSPTHFRNLSQSTKGWPRSATPTSSTHFRKMSQSTKGWTVSAPNFPLAARRSRDDAMLFTDSYFRRDG